MPHCNIKWKRTTIHHLHVQTHTTPHAIVHRKKNNTKKKTANWAHTPKVFSSSYAYYKSADEQAPADDRRHIIASSSPYTAGERSHSAAAGFSSPTLAMSRICAQWRHAILDRVGRPCRRWWGRGGSEAPTLIRSSGCRLRGANIREGVERKKCSVLGAGFNCRRGGC